jgi:hypothetical protein
MNGKPRRRPGMSNRSGAVNLDVVHPNAAGSDVGDESHYVAGPPDRDAEPVGAIAHLWSAEQLLPPPEEACVLREHEIRNIQKKAKDLGLVSLTPTAVRIKFLRRSA